MASVTTPSPRRSRVPYRVILAAIWLTIASVASLGLLYRLQDVVFDLVIATFIVISASVVAFNVATELACAYIDPRIARA